jgi:beta-glucanase (GH16 family)
MSLSSTLKIFQFILFISIYSTTQAQPFVTSTNGSTYRLVWSDEFTGYGIVDTTKWFHQTKLPLAGSWYNGEIQHYTNRAENSARINGVLNITARRENFSDQGFTKNYTSARLNSKFAFKYGKVECKVRLPIGVGTWPAIWMLGKNIDEDGAYWDNLNFDTTPWPACGEIDILEHWGSNQNFIQSAIHTPSSFGNTVNKGGRILNTASSEFHIYTMEWDADKIRFSVDSQEYYTYQPSIKNSSTWPFDEDQYLILNVAIQGNISSNFSQDAMEIDYIRVYQESSSLGMSSTSMENLQAYPNPFEHSIQIKVSEHLLNNQAMVQLHSMDGKLVYEKNIEHMTSLYTINDLYELVSGVYYVSITSNQQTSRIKIIKL